MELAWRLLRGLFIVTIVLGPIALVVIAVDTRLKKTPEGTYIAAIIGFVVGVVVITALAFILIWQMWHHEMAWTDWGRLGFVVLVLPGLWQERRKLRRLAAERRQARALAQSDDSKPSEFRYASETPK